MPGPALVLAAALERIGVEIMRSLAREAAQRAVEQRELHHVGVAAVEIEMQHAVSPEDEGDRGAGLGVGRLVRQVIGLGEALVRFPSDPRPGRHVHLRRRDVAPQSFAGALEAFVAELEREIGHRAQPCTCRAPHGRPSWSARGQERATGCIRMSQPNRTRVVAARDRFLSEIMRLTAALVDEISAQDRGGAGRRSAGRA